MFCVITENDVLTDKTYYPGTYYPGPTVLRLSQHLLLLLVDTVVHQDDAPEIEPFCIIFGIRTTMDRELLAGFVIF